MPILNEYEILVRLSEAPERTLRMSVLADGVAHSRSRLTHTVRRLEKDGYVERFSCTSDGRGVIVYPEGSLTRDPGLWPMRGKTGAVRLALAGELPVIPMATWGVQRILPRYGKLSLWPPRKRVRVALGPAVDLDTYRSGPRTNSNLVAATDAVMADIAGLLADLRGEPAPAERWDPAVHGQKETGRLESES